MKFTEVLQNYTQPWSVDVSGSQAQSYADMQVDTNLSGGLAQTRDALVTLARTYGVKCDNAAVYGAGALRLVPYQMFMTACRQTMRIVP